MLLLATAEHILDPGRVRLGSGVDPSQDTSLSWRQLSAPPTPTISPGYSPPSAMEKTPDH